MSNGKFFSGLPDSMLRGSSNRPDRMESHLFWPDESKTESVNNSTRTTPSKRATKPVTDEVQYYKEYTDQTPADTQKPKELFSKHQTSKIQFDDYPTGDYGRSSKNSGVRNNSNENNKTSVPVKNVNVTSDYNNRMGFNHNSAKLNALKSNIGFYDYPDESRVSKSSTARSSNYNQSSKQNDSKYQQQQEENDRQDQKNNSIIKSRSDENVLKCKMNNDLYDLDKKVNNLKMNSNNLNSSNDYSVNKTTRIIDDTINRGGDDEYQTPIKVHNSETRTSSYSSSHHGNSQQYQNSHNVEISLDRDYVSSRGCPQKSYNNITPLYSQQEQSPQ